MANNNELGRWAGFNDWRKPHESFVKLYSDSPVCGSCTCSGRGESYASIARSPTRQQHLSIFGSADSAGRYT